MTITVLDSGNLEAMVIDATGEGLAKPTDAAPLSEARDDATPKDDAKPNDDASADVEGDDGLTAREKQELSAKMLKAVGKRVREKREAEEFAAEQYNLRLAAERRAQDLEARLNAQPTQRQPAAEQPVSKAKPERQHFATDVEYIEAVTTHAVTEALAKKAAEDARVAAEQRQAEVLAAARERVAKAIKLVPDFEDVTSAADVNIPDHIAGYMQTSELFAELGYFLAKNQDVMRALEKMTPAKQLVEIGKIEGKLTPFAPKANADLNDGATPSTKSTNGTQPPKAAPREPTGDTQSAARRAAPVITPISTNGTESSDSSLENVRDHIAEFAKRRGVNLTRRQRH